MMTVEITALRPEDQPRWGELWRGYLAFYETVLPPEQFEDTWARLMHGTQIHGLAARRDGAMIGITHYLFHPTAWATGPACYLQDLYVDATARGTGAGRALIEAVAEQARERKVARLYWLTQEGNAVARRLYDRLARTSGFIRYEYPL
ncbi:MAG: GNAT family N-acetyltransferase [Acetobacteraceae bacterium]|nr:GNAT family N-acetyltransferase [Acetobacteraceae bacterium]